MYKTRLLIAFVCICFLSSCRSKRQENQKVDTNIETTRENIVTYKDTVVYAPRSETSFKIPVSDLAFKSDLNTIEKPKIFTQKNGNATAKIQVHPDFIYVTATCDSLGLIAKIKTKFEKEYRLKEVKNQSNKTTKTGLTFWNLITAFVIGFISCYAFKHFKIV